MRSDTPEWPMTLPVRMNNGTATRRKLFIEVYMNCDTTDSGRS